MATQNRSMARAGFWRRFTALLIDGLWIMIPFSVLAGALFALTDGRIQTLSPGVALTLCRTPSPIPEDIRVNLRFDPSSAGAIGTLCQVYGLGGLSAQTFAVGETAAGETPAPSQTFRLDADRRPVQVTDLSWLTQVGYVLYTIAMQASVGCTIGLFITRARIVRGTSDGLAAGVGRILLRNLLLYLGFAPSILLVAYAVYRLSVERTGSPTIVLIFIAAALLSFFWIALNLILIAMKADAVYDLLAGTAVVRLSVNGTVRPDGQAPEADARKPSKA